MVAYHCDLNAILVAPFKNWKDKHRLEAFDSIMSRLKTHNILTDLKILNNKASKEYKQTHNEDWGVEYQLVPPDIHRRNAAERTIRTFKAQTQD